MKTACILGLSFLLATVCIATGAKVSLTLNSGVVVTGELLVLSDSTLILTSDVGVSEDKLEADTNKLFRVRLGNIKSLDLCGKSYLADGMLLGAVGGIAIGALVAYAPSGHESGGNTNLDVSGPGASAMVVGLLAGSVAGGFFGEMSTTHDRKMSRPEWDKIPFLKAMTRYHDKATPDFLLKYIANG